ncbi:alpha-galactosidase, partial [candidate division KSB1 bacterium]
MIQHMNRAAMQLNSNFLTLLFDPGTGYYNILSDSLMLKDIRCYFVLLAGQHHNFKPGKFEIKIEENKARLISTGVLKLSFEAVLGPDSSYISCRLGLTNQSKREIFLDRAVLLDCILPQEMGDQLTMLKNPYCSGEPVAVVKVKRPAVRKRRTKRNQKNPPVIETVSSGVFTAIRDMKRRHQISLGFSSQEDFSTSIKLRGNRLTVECNLDLMRLGPGSSMVSEELLIDLATGSDTLLSYAGQMKKRMKIRAPVAPGIGFDLSRGDPAHPNEKSILQTVKKLAGKKEKFGVGYLLIGEGYQPEMASGKLGAGNWSDTNDRFPSGLRVLAEQIKEAGYKPGLTLSPFLIDRSNRIFKEKPHWLIKDARENPKPIVDWNGETAYALDTTQPSVQEWLKILFRTLTEDFGFDVFKIDNAYAAGVIGKRYDLRTNRFQAYRRGMEIIRDTIGPDRYLMAAGAPIGPSIGLVDIMETAPAEPPSMKRSANESRLDYFQQIVGNTYSRSFMNQRIWYNYSGPVPLGGEKGDPKLSEVRAWATLLALTGGLQVMNGAPDKISSSRLKLMGRINPPYGEGAQIVDYFGQEYPSFMFLPVETEFDRWILLGAFNWGQKVQDLSISLNRLGLKGSEEHHLFDFWKEEYEGRIKNKVAINNLQPRSARLLRIARVRKKVQLISSPFHFSQGAVGVRYFRPGIDQVEVRIDSATASNAKLWIYVPPE